MSKGRVLVVDDEPASANGLRDLLSAWGYEARSESDGIAALERAENAAQLRARLLKMIVANEKERKSSTESSRPR